MMRPLHALKNRKGIKIIKVKANAEGLVDPIDFAKAINSQTRLVALVHASNVTGTIQPIAAVGEIAATQRRSLSWWTPRNRRARLPIDVESVKIDLLAFPGHKALLGPLGTGALYVREGLDLETLREGGTGSQSEQEVQPDFLPG